MVNVYCVKVGKKYGREFVEKFSLAEIERITMQDIVETYLNLVKV